MNIKSISLINFRNHRNRISHFIPGKNLIYGDNGSGKTSVLEAIFFLGFGKSFFSIKKENMINYDADHFLIQANVDSRAGSHKLTGSFNKAIQIYLNDEKITLSRLNNYFYPLLFTSMDFVRYLEKKKHKRKLINRFIFAFESLYLNYLLDYNKTVKKKNILLKKEINSIEINSWNKILSDLSCEVVNYRVNFIRELNLYLKKFNKKLLVLYHPSLDISKGITRENFLKQFQDKMSLESRYNRSLVGPHLDDYRIERDGKDLNYSSSGEKKLHLLLIFAAMIYMYKDKNGEFPVFLLDDFDSAVDDKGLDYLFSILPEMQIIASSVSKNVRFENNLELGV